MKTKIVRKKGHRPYVELSEGSAVVKIYTSPFVRGGKTYTEHRLVYSCAGERVRLSFADLEEAKAESAKVLARINHGDVEATGFTSRERERYQAALDELANHGLDASVPGAVREYCAAMKLASGRFTLSEAVKFYAANGIADLPNKTALEVLDEMLSAMETDNPGGHLNRRNLRRYCGAFAKKFTGPIALIRNVEIDAWLRSLAVGDNPLGPKSRNHVAGAVTTLFGFARSAGYLPKNSDTGKNLSRAKVVPAETQIYQPAQVSSMLAKMQAVRPKYLPALAIMAFAGLRTEEVKRLAWEDVRYDLGVIEVRAKNAKTSARRPVPIQPNLMAWLAPFKGSTGLVSEGVKKMEIVMSRIINEQRSDETGKVWAPLKWLKNAFRHSFGSYRLQVVQDVGKVAFEMGNTPVMVNKHYRLTVTTPAAEAYWGIMPGEAKLATVTAINATSAA